MNKMNPVVHFEMPAEERKRMAAFYSIEGNKLSMPQPFMKEDQTTGIESLFL